MDVYQSRLISDLQLPAQIQGLNAQFSFKISKAHQRCSIRGQTNENESILNSGTWTSCLADLSRLPRPALRAKRSLSSFMVSCMGTLTSDRLGETLRVEAGDATSMSIIIDGRLRSFGSRAKDLRNVADEVGGGSVGAGIDIDGRSKDHERTRSSASA